MHPRLRNPGEQPPRARSYRLRLVGSRACVSIAAARAARLALQLPHLPAHDSPAGVGSSHRIGLATAASFDHDVAFVDGSHGVHGCVVVLAHANTLRGNFYIDGCVLGDARHSVRQRYSALERADTSPAAEHGYRPGCRTPDLRANGTSGSGAGTRPPASFFPTPHDHSDLGVDAVTGSTARRDGDVGAGNPAVSLGRDPIVTASVEHARRHEPT